MKKLMLLGLVTLQTASMIADQPKKSAQELLQKFEEHLQMAITKTKEELKKTDATVFYLELQTINNSIDLDFLRKGYSDCINGQNDNKEDCLQLMTKIGSFSVKPYVIAKEYFTQNPSNNHHLNTKLNNLLIKNIDEGNKTLNEFKAEIEKEIATEKENQKQ
jgi:hypothetical protein